MVTKKNIKFRQTRDGRTEAYDATTGKSLGYVTDMSDAGGPKKTAKKITKKTGKK